MVTVKPLPRYLVFDSKRFPNLNKRNHRVQSKQREEQNCIAFAAGDDIHYWWPIPGPAFPGKYPPPYFWPEDCPEEETLAAFEMAFATVGYVRCTNGQPEPGVIKIALFGDGRPGDPKAIVKHAAIQSPFKNGQWRSKMGVDYDIDHTALTAIEGPLYGFVLGYMSKPIADSK